MIQRVSPVISAAYMQLNSETPHNKNKKQAQKKKTQKPFSGYLDKSMEYVIGKGYLV